MIQTKCVFLTIRREKLFNNFNVFSFQTAIIQTSVNLYLILNKSYVIICMHMHIYLVLTLIHHRRGRSKHTTVISFLLPRLINNSWVTIAGSASRGEGGTPWDPLPKQDPLKNRKRKSEPETTLSQKKQNKTSRCFPHTRPPLWQKADHIHAHHHWHYGARSGIP